MNRAPIGQRASAHSLSSAMDAIDSILTDYYDLGCFDIECARASSLSFQRRLLLGVVAVSELDSSFHILSAARYRYDATNG